MLLAAAVLAGGASRRMGTDKASIEVGGVALYARVTAAAATVADPVVLVAPAGHPAAGLGPPVLNDPGEGPLAAVATALAGLDTPRVLVLAADHPDLHPALLRLLASVEAPAVVCRRAGRLEPLVAVYERVPALAVARAMLAVPDGDRSVRGLLTALGARVLEEPEWRVADPDGRSFEDLDDPAALAARRALG
jgi:molybdopterin-guanine dinucleotide biosynthesis protein A